ncbi:hypothetical protein [Pseudoduganella sp. UC29_71]|uniref:hypothetical protein n=1 Tax=Pseudoduganella sp. UC29_71 TaxID=3350174 RepID=UPI00366B7159
MSFWPASALQLDLRTLLLMTTVMSSVMSMVMLSVHRSFRGEVRGLDRWSLGLLCVVGAGIAFSLHGAALENAAILAGSALMFWGVGLSMIGTQEFFARRPAWGLFHGVWLVGMLLTGWLLLAQPHLGARIAVFSLAAFIFYAVQCWLVWRHGMRHFSYCFFGALMTVQALAVLARLVTALSVDAVNMEALRNGPLVACFVEIQNWSSFTPDSIEPLSKAAPLFGRFSVTKNDMLHVLESFGRR